MAKAVGGVGGRGSRGEWVITPLYHGGLTLPFYVVSGPAVHNPNHSDGCAAVFVSFDLL